MAYEHHFQLQILNEFIMQIQKIQSSKNHSKLKPYNKNYEFKHIDINTTHI